ncbi:hypothetical protein [Kitasatospora sp. NPDC088346]|uniref:hypothetical protein n=1 Tax=Kitasatospora sp. NPDC088346 TaxID=3364073 RepID=UPI00381C8C20
MQLIVPKRIICASVRPISARELAATLLDLPSRLVPRYLVAFERMTPAEQAAVRRRQEVESAKRWARVEQWAQVLQDEKREQQRRRAAAFAAALDLPDPLHWLDELTSNAVPSLAVAV